jgi:hypothetical protein
MRAFITVLVVTWVLFGARISAEETKKSDVDLGQRVTELEKKVQMLEARIKQLEAIINKPKETTQTPVAQVQGNANNSSGTGYLEELMKSRERARRVKCMNFLKQLGIALQMYSDDYDEKFPLDLRFLYSRYFIDSELLVCPSTDTSKATAVVPTDYKVGKPANIPAENMSYCYVAGLKTTDPADYILVFDEDTNHKGEGVNVLYIGQNVIWQTDLNAIRAQLKKQEEALKAQGREMKIIRPSEEIKKAQP